MARKTKAEAADPRTDETLLRHVRLVKPHLAPPGFKTDKWATVAAAVNREIGRKVWSSGNAAQGRYSHIVVQYNKSKDALSPVVRRRMTEYLELLATRTGQAVVQDDLEDESQDDEEGEEEETMPTEDIAAVEETEEAPPDLPQPDREPLVEAAIDLLEDTGPAAGIGRPQVMGVFAETVASLREMTAGLLQVIRDDRAARREEHKELVDVVRLVLKARE